MSHFFPYILLLFVEHKSNQNLDQN